MSTQDSLDFDKEKRTLISETESCRTELVTGTPFSPAARIVYSKIAKSAAHARRTDPQTSHEAAKSVRNISETHAIIMDVFSSKGPLTDEQLIAIIRRAPDVRVSDSGIRSRRSELVKLGKIREHNQNGRTTSGRKCTVWEIAE